MWVIDVSASLVGLMTWTSNKLQDKIHTCRWISFNSWSCSPTFGTVTLQCLKSLNCVDSSKRTSINCVNAGQRVTVKIDAGQRISNLAKLRWTMILGSSIRFRYEFLTKMISSKSTQWHELNSKTYASTIIQDFDNGQTINAAPEELHLFDETMNRLKTEEVKNWDSSRSLYEIAEMAYLIQSIPYSSIKEWVWNTLKGISVGI